MRTGGFVEAVTYAIANDSDNWECPYYHNCDRMEWDSTKGLVYMETRRVALGPEWSELRRCVTHMDGVLSRIKRVRMDVCSD